MKYEPFYDYLKTFDDNFDDGPFGAFKKTKPFKPQGKPQYSFLGYKIYSPFGIAAGPLPNSKFIKAAFDMGFDVNCYKTQRSTIFPVNQFPNVLFVDVRGDLTLEKAKKPLVGSLTTTKDRGEFSITNSFGNPSRGPQFWQKDLKEAMKYEGKGQLLIMGVVGTIKKGFSDEDYYDDFAASAEIANKTGVRVIEVNLSCPNVASEGILCFTPGAVEAICRKVREKIGKTPLIAKVGYYGKDRQELLEIVVEKMVPYVGAIAAINTIPAPVVDAKGNQALPGPNRLMSGICGAGIKWAGVDMVRRLKDIRQKKGYGYEIVGVGGVMDVDDYRDYREAGADVVMSATGAMWNPYLAREIKGKSRKRISH
ncbi:diguanylate cyclase [Candidatus Gottesmanbacteria bacterium]|nr:diguanylate cyclase [Candidatus Gottesmanbacteria bacterium]